MDKTPTTHVDASMCRVDILRKQHQIARTKFVTGHLQTPISQFGYRSRRHDTRSSLVNMTDQATAIKTSFWRITTIAVRCTDQTHGINGDVIGLVRCQSRGYFSLQDSVRCTLNWRRSGAPSQYKKECQANNCAADAIENSHTRIVCPARSQWYTVSDGYGLLWLVSSPKRVKQLAAIIAA